MTAKTWTFAEGLEIIRLLREECHKRPNEEALKFIKFCLEHAARTRSQFFQELWVAWELDLQTNGFFVEFGAANGRHSSNTYFLEKHLGWRGILAEPARHWYPHIYRYRACFIDRRAVFTATGDTVTFIQPEIALHSTIVGYENGDKVAETRAAGERYDVETVTLNDLLETWSAPRRIDYVSVDTEGSEYDILTGFDFDKWDVRLMSIEHAGNEPKRAAIHDLMTKHGYVRRLENLSQDDDWYKRVYPS